MSFNRTLRSSTFVDHVMLKDQARDTSTKAHSAVGRTNAAVKRKAEKTQNASRRSEASPPSPPSKKARVKTPDTHQKALSGMSETCLSTPTSRPDNTNTSNPLLFLDRPVGPHRTNAPLITPRGLRLVTDTEEVLKTLPSKTGLPNPTSTTRHILDEACAHLISVEPKLGPLIEKYYCRVFSPESLSEEIDPFRSLCSSIMAQQVSGAAASSIKRKFIGLFHADGLANEATSFPTPAQVAACNVPFLRQAGLSERKAEYIKGLSEKFMSGELSATMLISASDAEILNKLTAVRGLGKWSGMYFHSHSSLRRAMFRITRQILRARAPARFLFSLQNCFGSFTFVRGGQC